MSARRVDKVSGRAASSTILDLEGKPHELREVWADRTVVLAFVRHFG